MLTTRFGGGLRARPLEPRPDRDEGVDLVRDRCARCTRTTRSQPRLTSASSSSITRTRPISRSPAALRVLDDHAQRRRRSGRRPTTCGGRTGRAIRMCACCGWCRSAPSCGTAHLIPPSPPIEFAKARVDRREAESRREPQGDGGDEIIPGTFPNTDRDPTEDGKLPVIVDCRDDRPRRLFRFRLRAVQGLLRKSVGAARLYGDHGSASRTEHERHSRPRASARTASRISGSAAKVG